MPGYRSLARMSGQDKLDRIIALAKRDNPGYNPPHVDTLTFADLRKAYPFTMDGMFYTCPPPDGVSQITLTTVDNVWQACEKLCAREADGWIDLYTLTQARPYLSQGQVLLSVCLLSSVHKMLEHFDDTQFVDPPLTAKITLSHGREIVKIKSNKMRYIPLDEAFSVEDNINHPLRKLYEMKDKVFFDLVYDD